MTETTAVTETALTDAEELANALFPAPGPGHMQVCMVGGGTTAGDLFYRLRNDIWSEVGPYGADKAPRLRDALREHGSWRLRMSPFLSSAPTTSCISEFGVVPVVVALPLVPPERVRMVASDSASKGQLLLEHIRQGRNEHVYDPHAKEQALAKLRALAIQPNCIIDQGAELVACYVLEHALRNDPAIFGNPEGSPFVNCTHRLATRLGQRADYAHRPGHILIDLVGVHRDDVKLPGHFTGFDVTAVQLHDTPVAFKALEEFSRTR